MNAYAIQLQIFYRCDELTPDNYNFEIGIAELNLHSRIQSRINCIQGKMNKLDYQLKVGNIRLELWYPRNYGESKLYDLKVTANYRFDNTWQKEFLHKYVGFRHVRLNRDLIDSKNSNLGRNFAFSVNGIPIFLKGTNFIPTSVFPSDFSRRKLEFLFYSLVEANINTIRVWGGGNWPDDEFFDLADKHGILVFHDLMFACALYPVNPEFLLNIKEEITEQVFRIRNHPSILVYSGNNEIEIGIRSNWWFGVNYTTDYMIQDYTKLMHAAIEALRIADPTAIVIRSSPSNGNISEGVDLNPNNPAYGDVHFYNEYLNLWKPENLVIPRCATEFGVPSFPLRSTMLNYLPESEWSYTGRLINLRNHHPFGFATLLVMLSQHFSIPWKNNKIDMDNFAYISQIHQAITVRVQSEHYRRYRSFLTKVSLGHTMCALYWQLNDVWAAPTWSSIDFNQRWKAAHYHFRHMFAPLLISMYIDTTQTLQVYLVSDFVEPIENAKLRLRMMSLDNRFVSMYEQNFSVSLPPLASTKFNYANLRYPYDQDFFFKAELYKESGEKVSEGFLPLEKLYNNAMFGMAQVHLLSQLNSSVYELEIRATDVVPFAWLDLNTTRLANKGVNVDELRYHFSDNAFYITEPVTKIFLYLYDSNSSSLILDDITLCWIYNC